MKANDIPAFPGGSDKAYGIEYPANEGMTLRDWFAGMALQGELSCQEVCGWPLDAARSLAERCYEFSDAMLEEREK